MERAERDINDNGDKTFGSKIRKPRTAKACDFCRHRKIKCDGKQPCSNCQETDSQNCVYAPPASRNLKHDRKEKRNKSLEDRLARVESLLEGLATQNNKASDEHGNQGVSAKTRAIDDTRKELENSPVDHFTGSHFHFCSHSASFVESFKRKLPVEFHELLIPFENMPGFFSESVRSFEDNWTSSLSSNLTTQNEVLGGDFLRDSETIMDLLKKYYVQDVWATFVCTLNELEELFSLYYINDGIQGRKLQESEFLLMNMAVLLSIRGKLDNLRKFEYKKGHHEKTIQDFKYFTDLQDKCFLSSMFYYHRVSLLSEGIQTVKALMLMIIYTEYNIANSRLDHGLLCLAVRYAEDIGLHDTSSGPASDQMDMQKKLWCAIEYFDVEMAYRKGRAPFIKNGADLQRYCQNKKDQQEPSVADIFDMDNDFDYSQAFYEFTKLLTRIRRKTYTNIVNSSKVKTLAKLHDSVTDLKADMKNFALLFPFRHQPLLVSDERFDLMKLKPFVNTTKSDSILMLTAQISYISHLMFLNTIPFMYDISSSSSSQHVEFERVSKNCARTILSIATILDCRVLPTVISNTMIHHVVSAFLCLLYDPSLRSEENQRQNDMKLLIKVCNQFFSTCFSDGDFDERLGKVILSKEKKYEVLCVSALKTGARIVRLSSGVDVLKNEGEFNHHFINLTRCFPSLFEKDNSESSHAIRSSDSSQKTHSSPSNELYSTFASDYTMKPYDGINERPNMGGTIWNDLAVPTMESGLGNIHDFFFDSTFGI